MIDILDKRFLTNGFLSDKTRKIDNSILSMTIHLRSKMTIFRYIDKSIFPVRQPPPAPSTQEEAACAC
jgi:hypothetical protein